MPQSFFGWVGLMLEKYGSLFWSGTLNTLLIAVSGTVFGFLLGLLIAIARTIRLRAHASRLKRACVKLLQGFLGVYIEIFRGTPMIVQAMVIYYGVLQFTGINMPRMFAAILIVSINTAAYMAEIIRGGIISVDKGQYEAAHSLGLTHWQAMTSVILPQAIRNIMPSIGNEFVVNIKDSSVLNVISVTELFFQSKSAVGAYYRYFEVYFIIALIYLTLTFTITRLLRLLERKMDGPDNYRIHGSQSDSHAVITVHRNKEEGA